MVKGMGGFGGLGSLMKQAQKQAAQFQKQLEEVQRSMADRVVEGTAGGGMVVAQMNGKQDLVALKIDPEVVDPNDVEMLQDLIIAAITQASKKAREMYQEEMNRITGGLNVPGIGGLAGLM